MAAMSYRSLAEFLEALSESGELSRVEATVNADLEAAEITRRVAAAGGQSVLLAALAGRDMPVVTNLLGSPQRICRALGVGGLAELTERVALALAPSEPEGWFERLRSVPQESSLRRFVPRLVKTGACQQVVRLGSDVNLGHLPALRCWPDEVRPTITAGVFFAADPELGRIVGRHDFVPLDADRLAACWAPFDEPARLLEGAHRGDKPVPAAVVLGGDPAGLLAASATLAPRLDRAALAGLLRDKPLELVRCRSSDLEVPADADVVIEGYLDRRAPAVDVGPRATPLGTCAPPCRATVMQVTAITHRGNPVFPAQVHSQPPNEACAIARAMAQVFLPVVKLGVPDLVDLDLPLAGGVRQIVVASIDKRYAGQARRVAHALWGLPGLMLAKWLVIVDGDVDVRDPAQFTAAIARHVDPAHDIFFTQGPPDPWQSASTADHAGQLAQRLGIDATAKLPGERGPGSSMAAIADPPTIAQVSQRWAEYGLGE